MTKQTKPAFNPNKIYEEVTDKIIARLEAGTVPWQMPFLSSEPCLSMPLNTKTGKKYRGINILLLWMSAVDHNYATQEWATMKQWNEQNEYIRKGESPHTIIKYDVRKKDVDGEEVEIPFVVKHRVFNRCQLANYQPHADDTPKISIVKKAEIADQFVKNTKALIEYNGDKAYYSRSQDKIVMPFPEYFIDTEVCTATEGHYSVLFHELSHWTGDKNRLDRTKGKKFGDRHYAYEELVAEFGASFLCANFKMNMSDHRNIAAYIDHWLKVLKDDKKLIFSAASHATKAVEYLEGLQPS